MILPSNIDAASCGVKSCSVIVSHEAVIGLWVNWFLNEKDNDFIEVFNWVGP